MGETNCGKIKPVYFNLDDEDELKLYEEACKIKNFSKWVKKQISIKEKTIEQDRKEIRVEIQNQEIDSMMI
jgi:hypothetical protein